MSDNINNNWTKELPTKEGWYWNWDARFKPPINMVEVVFSNGQYWAGNGEDSTPVVAYGGLWHGPIEPPTPPYMGKL